MYSSFTPALRSAGVRGDAHIQLLDVTPRLTVVCFKRSYSTGNGVTEPGPLFVVREWDAKVMRASGGGKKNAPKPGANEQAMRASVRQNMLNLNLHLEPATKAEILYLKGTGGILGKRAPSCSLLGTKDLMKLLICFDKRKAAEDLRLALGEEANVSTDEAATLCRPKGRPHHIVLEALPKRPIPASAFHVHVPDIQFSHSTIQALLKRALRMPIPFTPPHRPPPKRKAPSPSPVKPAGAGLDALLSALTPAPSDDHELEEDDEDEEEAAQQNAPMPAAFAALFPPQPAVDDDGFALPQHKRAKLASTPADAAAMPSPHYLAMAIAAQTAHTHDGSHSARVAAPPHLSMHGLGSPMFGTSGGGGGGSGSGGVYQSPALGFKRNPSLTSLARDSSSGMQSPSFPATPSAGMQHMGMLHSLNAMQGGMSVPQSPVAGHGHALSPSPSAALYRNLTSPSPSPAPHSSATPVNSDPSAVQMRDIDTAEASAAALQQADSHTPQAEIWGKPTGTWLEQTATV